MWVLSSVRYYNSSLGFLSGSDNFDFIFMYAEVMKHLLLEYWARVKTSTTLNQNGNLVA